MSAAVPATSAVPSATSATQNCRETASTREGSQVGLQINADLSGMAISLR